MNNVLFLKRIFSNKIYWLSVLAATVLLVCSVVYEDVETGKEYMFFELFYNEVVQETLHSGVFSLSPNLIGNGMNYLWMFCPIIVGIPCIIVGKTERLVMFRTSKNRYVFSKYFSGLIASGLILVIAYLLFSVCCMAVVSECLWDLNFVKKLASVFGWGIYCAFSSAIISEIVQNKYLILCIPFVINYFMCIFLGNILPYQVVNFISPWNYQTLLLREFEESTVYILILLVLVAVCALLKKVLLERRCDCGQR